MTVEVIVAIASGFGMVICLALGLCKSASDGDEIAHRTMCEIRRQEREARRRLHPPARNIAAAPRHLHVVSDAEFDRALGEGRR
jgi:hypothetical protein